MTRGGRRPRGYRPKKCRMGCGRNAPRDQDICEQCIIDTATGCPPDRPMSKKLRKQLGLDERRD